MIIRVDHFIIPLDASQQFYSAVCKDFIHIHIQRSSCPSLDRIHDNFTVEFSLSHFRAGVKDRPFPFFVQGSRFIIGSCRSRFHIRHAPDHFRMDMQSRHTEIFCRAHGLYAVICIFWHFSASYGICFCPISHLYILLSFCCCHCMQRQNYIQIPINL